MSSPVTTLAQPSDPPAVTAPRLRTPRRHSPGRPRRSVLLTVLTGLVLLYSLVPLAWLIISATKTQEGLAHSFGLWFNGDFALWDNIRETFTYSDGVFTRWLLNTVLYVVVGAGGATLLAVLGGYALASSSSPANAPSSPSSSVPSRCRAPPWPSPRS